MSETVKLIIEIPKKVFEARKTGEISPWVTVPILDAVQNGILLPKGHGRLIDVDVLVDGMEDDYEFCEAVNATPTIIEADKERKINEL